MRDDGPYSPYYYKKEFGTWHEALQAANIQPTHGVTADVNRTELIDALKEVDKQIDQSPRRSDVEEYGEYPYELYTKEFGSFVIALEEAGITPAEIQYRFSNVEVPPEMRGSENIEKLRNEGPTLSTELPQDVSMKDRQRGVWDFKISSGMTKPAHAIHYLRDEHAPELVIRRFFSENPHILKQRDPHGIKLEIGEHQPSWKSIGQDITDELVEHGGVEGPSLENLVLVDIYDDEDLQYCFSKSVSQQVNTSTLVDEEESIPNAARVWGFRRENQEIYEALSKNDGLLFSTDSNSYTHYVPVEATVESSNLMADLWVEYEDGTRTGGIDSPRPNLVVGTDIQRIDIPRKMIEKEFTAVPDQGPTRLLTGDTIEPFVNKYGTVDAFLRDRKRSEDPFPAHVDGLCDTSTVEDILAVLRKLSHEEIPQEEIESELESIEREKREAAFREGVYELYEGCAVCGSRIEGPDGSHNLEAAHILPKNQGGPDVLQNGVALCRRHHWAFDSGWFDITTEYSIIVRDRPDLAGYDKIKSYDGSSLRLPESSSLRPHPTYLGQRNTLNEVFDESST
ncbi:restriction endonuclease-like protein [Haloferax elongans ATCC BAA-1513]|uniref:Restriction endonuclease-like protein n=2 Tax=Haloferax elongans TaxID=403191 RepID=M0HWC9_HALEO|nr:restriction endonuclease-like protein [Haloferax elongans ATCC BAA-1513]